MLHEFAVNFSTNLFKPLILFFSMGLLVPILRIPFEFPKPVYEALTIYLLLAIGWHGGEELALLSSGDLIQAALLVGLGILTNATIGLIAFEILRRLKGMRLIDAATIAGYYGSDSAGTFVTCLGVLATAHIAFEPYSPVLLAAMEIPGCLVALFFAGTIRRKEEALVRQPVLNLATNQGAQISPDGLSEMVQYAASATDLVFTPELSQEPHTTKQTGRGLFEPKLLHEVFLNPSIYLLVGGLTIGFFGRLQGIDIVKADDALLNNLFQGFLCFFLLEMGITASKRLRDIHLAGWRLALFALIMPNVFAAFGLLMMCLFSLVSGFHFALGTYVIFSVLCASASYIAVPAVQRMAIPEASPSLPLIASLGVTFTYNVTVGIPLYIELAKVMTQAIAR